MPSRKRILRLVKAATKARRSSARQAQRRLSATIKADAGPGEDARAPAYGERLPTEEDPRFAIRCVCGGIAGGAFPVLAIDGDR